RSITAVAPDGVVRGRHATVKSVPVQRVVSAIHGRCGVGHVGEPCPVTVSPVPFRRRFPATCADRGARPTTLCLRARTNGGPVAGARTRRRNAPSAYPLFAVALVVTLVSVRASATAIGDARLCRAGRWSSVAGGTRASGRPPSSVQGSPVLRRSRPFGAPAAGTASSDGLGTFFHATVSDRVCNL